MRKLILPLFLCVFLAVSAYGGGISFTLSDWLNDDEGYTITFFKDANQGATIAVSAVLLETGDYALLETGDKILLE